VLQNKEKIHVDWQAQLKAVAKSTTVIIAIVVAAFALLALTTYSPQDPGWRMSVSSSSYQNLGGAIGAYLSDILFSLVGYVAYLLPTVLAIQMSQRIWHPPLHYGWAGWLWRFSGFLLLILSSCVLVGTFDVSSHLPAGPAGALGQNLAPYMTSQLGVAGATLFASAVFLISVTVISDLDWLATLDRIGGMTLGLIKSIQSKTIFLAKTFKGRSESTATEILHIADRTEPVVDDDPLNALNGVSVPVVSAENGSPSRHVDDSDDDVVSESQVVEPAPAPVVLAKKAKPKTKAVPANDMSDQEKKLKIQPFEKKSKGPASMQGNLFASDALPSLSLLNRQEGEVSSGYSPEKLEEMSRLLEQKLKDFGVKVEVVAVNPGPVITRFEIQPAPGVKASKITNLAQDLARSLAMVSVRVVEVIPGKSVMGLEVPNEKRAMVYLGDVLASTEYQGMTSPLSFALGHDIAGDPVTADLAKMPHLLVAGTTGSGKSVGVNSMLISMLYKSTPDDLRLIMVDPKMLELSVYDGIPHLLSPVITDMKEAANGLRWCVGEMERRYKLMASLGVRNIAGYNKKVLDAIDRGEPLKDPLWNPDESFDPVAPDLGKLPYIVVVIDEFADMMMIVGKKVEELIARIAQKARAAGIHLILATQRPSVDIITGLIKANVPTRMAFQVSSRIDSRTILDQGGAEQLLGHGDMLYLPPGTSLPIRVHGAFVDDDEVHAVVADWKARGEPEFIEAILEGDSSVVVPGFPAEGSDDGEGDALFDEAVAFVTETRKVSISSVQRKLRIGYNRAARLVETMEQAGVVSEPGTNGSREVLAPPPVPH